MGLKFSSSSSSSSSNYCLRREAQNKYRNGGKKTDRGKD